MRRAISNAAGALNQKCYHRGTHRVRSPAETCRIVEPHRRALGITRVANVTGLDRVGIPVALAVRPNARSLSVAAVS